MDGGDSRGGRSRYYAHEDTAEILFHASVRDSLCEPLKLT